MKKSRAKEDNPVTSVIRPILLGVGVGVVACLMLLLLSTFAFVSSKHIPRNAMAVLTLVIAAVSSAQKRYADGISHHVRKPSSSA